MMCDKERGRRERKQESTTTDCIGGTRQKARFGSRLPPFLCHIRQEQTQHGVVGGIIASTSKAAIMVAIQAHLPEELGREGRREREEREQIYQKRREGGGVACSQCVTEIERFHERGRAQSRDGDRTPRQW